MPVAPVSALSRDVRAWLRRKGVLRSYRVTEIPTFGGTGSRAHDLNDGTVVVGSADLPNQHAHAYRWQAHAMVDLGAFPGPDFADAFAINNQGFVAGQSQVPPTGDDTHGFVVPPDTTISTACDVGTLHGPNSVVFDFSMDHVGAGWADTPAGVPHAFVRSAGGEIRDLTPALQGASAAEAVDGQGSAVGWMTVPGNAIQAFRAYGHALTPLTGAGVPFSRARGVAPATGVAVGEATLGGQYPHAVVWDARNAVTDLGTLGGSTSVAYGVNNSGEVVGSSDTASGERHAFLASAGGGPMVDLNALINRGSGWVLVEARAINAHGEIVGNGTLNGLSRGFLLT
jgi:probable HAF family extracellular repeat protein